MDKSIFEKALRKASAILVMAALLLLAISLASTQKALAEDDAVTAGGRTPVPYVDSKGEAHECTDYTNTSALGSGEWTLSTGWYVVDKSVTSNPGIHVHGTVNLILRDGITLNTTHVLVEQGNTLIIWGQQRGTGKLKATGAEDYAGIGSGANKTCGKIVIYGGDIEAHGGVNGAGIGGGSKGNGCECDQVLSHESCSCPGRR